MLPEPRIRPARPADMPALLHICHDTVQAGQAPDCVLALPDLPGWLYVAPYLQAPGSQAWVFEDEAGVAGYAAGNFDSETFYAWFNSHWLPARRRDLRDAGAVPGATGVAATGANDASTLQARLLARLNAHWHSPPGLQRYPAHLHINLLPRARGQGAGRALIQVLLASLAQAGALGVHWGVDPANLSALGFYRKLGFAVVQEAPGCSWFAAPLA